MVNIETSVKKINGYLKKSSAWIVEVGKELAKVQSLASEQVYLSMFDMLPFGAKVGAKFIAIANDKYIEKYVDIVPAAYNVIYDMLLADKIKTKTGLNADIVWNEIGKNVMFGGEEYDFTISDKALNPTSTHNDIADIFKMLTMASKKPDLAHGGLEGATGELSEWLDKEKELQEAKKAQAKKEKLTNPPNPPCITEEEVLTDVDAADSGESKSKTPAAVYPALEPTGSVPEGGYEKPYQHIIAVKLPADFVQTKPALVAAFVQEVKTLALKYVDTPKVDHITFDKGVVGFLYGENVTKSVPASKKVTSTKKKPASKSVSEPALAKAA